MTPGIAQFILVVGGVFLVIGLLIGVCLTLCWDKMWTRVGESYVRPAFLADEERLRNQVRSFSRGTGFRLGEDTSSSATQVRREDGASSSAAVRAERAASPADGTAVPSSSAAARAERADGPAAGAAEPFSNAAERTGRVPGYPAGTSKLASSNFAGRAERAQGPAAGASASSSSSTAAGAAGFTQASERPSSGSTVRQRRQTTRTLFITMLGEKFMWIGVVMDYVKPR